MPKRPTKSPDFPSERPPESEIAVERHGIILEPRNLDFERCGVLNPACVRTETGTHLFYRAIDISGVSSIGYARFDEMGTLSEQPPEPMLVPEYQFESEGIEDPRITYLDGTYHMIYCAWDGQNARLAHAVSDDLVTFEKLGPIGPEVPALEALEILPTARRPEYASFVEYLVSRHGRDTRIWDKDGYLLPEKSNGEYVLFHRIFPDIEAVTFKRFEDLHDQDFWRNHLANLDRHTVMRPGRWFESRHVGGGAPPIKTEAGWLHVYHGVTASRHYSAGAFLTALDRPTEVIASLDQPLFQPTADYERIGAIAEVVFPTSVIPGTDRLDIYYGAADSRIALASLELDPLVERLRQSPTGNGAD